MVICRRISGPACRTQLRVDGRIVDGELEETMTYEPLDERQADIFTRFAGATYPLPPRRFVPVGRDLFAPPGSACRP